MKLFISSLVIFFFLFTPCVHPAEIIDFNSLLKQAVTRYEDIDNYTCMFHKKELVNGKLREDRNIFFKFKKPDHFYMKWTKGGNRGVEAIYVKDKFDNKLIVHLSGILSFIKVSIDPKGHLAMKNNRHPIEEAGLGYIISLIEKNYLMSKNDAESIITYYGGNDLDGRKTIVVKAVFPEGKEYYSHIIYVYFDKESYLPVKVIVYDWDNAVIEDYHFENIKYNVGLTEMDFNPDNPEYGF